MRSRRANGRADPRIVCGRAHCSFGGLVLSVIGQKQVKRTTIPTLQNLSQSHGYSKKERDWQTTITGEDHCLAASSGITQPRRQQKVTSYCSIPLDATILSSQQEHSDAKDIRLRTHYTTKMLTLPLSVLWHGRQLLCQLSVDPHTTHNLGNIRNAGRSAAEAINVSLTGQAGWWLIVSFHPAIISFQVFFHRVTILVIFSS